MAKGYWFAQVDITDADAYRRYQAANAEPFKKYGARFIVRGGTAEVVEGAFRSRQVILEFPTYEAALECYRSELYQAAKAARAGAASGDIVVLAGYDGVQPGDS
jgi:uncharacterized protein (DUF1330 family)